MARELGVDPLAITRWPALLFERAKFYLAVSRQREADANENRAARRNAGLE